ncbi:MAG TPA: hypothetical protein VM165_12840 [Planctomycetaceae bacterium]|nr:hypothetical protein [Planctomycetaceae bacterium]
MFILYRYLTGPTEIFSIMGDPSDFPDGDRRFGKLMRVDERDEAYYDIGSLVLIHREWATDVFVMGRDELTELENAALTRQIEHLCGKAAWMAVDEQPKRGWFWSGSFDYRK